MKPNFLSIGNEIDLIDRVQFCTRVTWAVPGGRVNCGYRVQSVKSRGRVISITVLQGFVDFKNKTSSSSCRGRVKTRGRVKAWTLRLWRWTRRSTRLRRRWEGRVIPGGWVSYETRYRSRVTSFKRDGGWCGWIGRVYQRNRVKWSGRMTEGMNWWRRRRGRVILRGRVKLSGSSSSLNGDSWCREIGVSVVRWKEVGRVDLVKSSEVSKRVVEVEF